MTWIKTATGRRIDFVNPDKSQIDFRDVFIVLGRNHRFGGHSPVKVGQHDLEVTMMMWRWALENGYTVEEAAVCALIGFVHDLPEFAVGDIPTPLKRLLGPIFAEIEDRILRCFLELLDLVDAWDEHHEMLKFFDDVAVKQEALRFGLDGKFIDEEQVTHDVPNEWVPSTTPITLRADVYNDGTTSYAMTIIFTHLMALANRVHLLPRALSMEDVDMSSKEAVLEATKAHMQQIPSMFVDGYRVAA